MLEQDHLKRILNYDKETGIFTWLVKPSARINIGEVAGCIAHNRNSIYIAGKAYFASRLAWLYITGKEPNDNIDHIDGNSLNDKFNNLRDVNQAINGRNQKLNKNNTSGCTGVLWNKQANKWQVGINIKGQRKHLGYYKDLNKAIAVRKKAEKENNYHENHGRVNNAAI